MAQAETFTSNFSLVDCGSVDSMSSTMHEIAANLGSRITEVGLIGYGNVRADGIHTETVYREDICPYFLLGCVQKAEVGGESLIYDATKAAAIISEDFPEMRHVMMNFRADPDGKVQSLVPLIGDSGDGSEVLRYRQQYILDEVHDLPAGLHVNDFYGYIDAMLGECIELEHQLQPGEILVVNNRKTLHSRQPYSGIRKLIRLRVDEPI